MRTHLLCTLALLVSVIGGASAQTQTDISVSGSADITQTATGNGITLTTPNWFGGVVEFRHIASPLLGFDGAYSVVAPHDHTYTTSVPLSPYGFPCNPSCSFQPGPTKIEYYAQTVSGAWLPSMKVGKGRLFALAGAGLFIAVPDTEYAPVVLPGSNGGGAVLNIFSTTTTTSAAYVYGAGFDMPLSGRFGLRLQYRGEMYKAPNVAPKLFPSTNTYIQSADPSIGVYIRL